MTVGVPCHSRLDRESGDGGFFEGIAGGRAVSTTVSRLIIPCFAASMSCCLSLLTVFGSFSIAAFSICSATFRRSFSSSEVSGLGLVSLSYITVF